MIGRRGFITGLVSLVAAPAIVRVASIMPVKVMPSLSSLELINQAMLDAAECAINPPWMSMPLFRFEHKHHTLTLVEYARIAVPSLIADSEFTHVERCG